MPKATTRESKRPRTSATIAAEQYLYLAVRLFVATSGKNDPLILDFSAAENAGRQNPFETKSYKQARVAVKQEGWLSKGIFNSGDYLQRLFEDSGEIIIEQDEIEKLERGEEEEIPSGHNSSGESGLEKVDPISPGQPSSPRIWTRGTGAARFLFLEPLKKLIARRRKLFFRGAEPIVQEEKRGLLRVFGSGEGYEQPAGYPDCDANSDRSSFGSFGRSSASSFGSFGSNEWGQLGGLTPDGDQSHAQEYNKPDRMPDFDRDTITASVRSYKANIHILHPIISLATLDMLVEGFLRSIPVTSEQAHTQESGSKPQAPSDLQQSKAPSLSNKRKRSPSISEASDTQGYGVWENARPGRPFRTTSTALVLLVIALGQICIHGVRILLPDEIPSQASYQRRYRNPKPNANQSIIPGLSYFALATDIIGNQVGGNSLLHVHVNILAALYHGQLARVLESHAYIHQACRSLQFILTSQVVDLAQFGSLLTCCRDFDKFKKLKSKDRHPLSKDNPLLFAFWTCVQLEGEIISELPCPASGLISYEDHVPTPNFTAAVEEGFSVEVIESFRAHLFLRKHLKQVHNMFCAPSDSIHFYSMFSTSDLEYFPTIIAAEANLRSLSILTPNLKWNEDDPPRSILAARLRFEYFSAEVITFQYFLLKIMEHSTANSTDSMNNQTIAGNFKKDISVPAINSEVRTIDDLDPNIQEYAQKCIKALIRCLGAFFALGDPGRQRLIVPNVWVIAHRQWGHVLLLVAAYMDSILQPLLLTLVTKRELYYLVGKTSSFLEMAGDKKAALGIDLNILSLINDVLREGILPNSPLLHDLTSFSQ
ncbi:hypothetical protein BKA61DRAFT_497754 [Leptodontidium sp. MPI-SDFR-AT-0119]|nr:hypothetical protein BKA61DRAFT_497754 [Leptodontidium sp. MPI-SDFR-AT-0119]